MQRIVFWMTAAVLAMSNVAQAQDAALITASNISTGPGGHPEVTISLQATGEAPVALVLFYDFDAGLLTPDANYYETIVRTGSGQVQRDANGNAVVLRGAVKPSAALAAAEKALDFQVYAEGVLGIAISGLNDEPIPNGPLCTIGFKADPAASTAANSLLGGIVAANAQQVTNPVTGVRETAFSSAADDEENDMTVVFQGGNVSFACGGGTAAPNNLAATDDDTEAVELTWSATTSGAEYRVWRSDTANFAQAVPLGAGWQVALSYSDFSATASALVQSGGGCDPTVSDPQNTQFYWVVARVNGCESSPAGPVEGARVRDAKAVQAASMAPSGNLFVCAGVAFTLILAARLRKRSAK